MCERLHGRWQRAHGRLTSGDISSERWAELSTEIDKVILRLRSHQLRRLSFPCLQAFSAGAIIEADYGLLVRTLSPTINAQRAARQCAVLYPSWSLKECIATTGAGLQER